MTLLHSGPRADTWVGVLDGTHRSELQRLLDADPYVNAVISARLQTVGTTAAHRLGGTLVGVHRDGQLTSACFSGGNLLPVGGVPEDWELLADFVIQHRKVCTSVVGRADAVTHMWSKLVPEWGRARTIRPVQPLLVLDTLPSATLDTAVEVVQSRQLDRYVAAAAAMFAEELGVSPHVSPGTQPFRARIAELIETGRALARCDSRGQVIFKAEIGAVTPQTAQIQGVWVRPDLRRRGIGTAAMAAVLRHALSLAPSASLYVNDFNIPAQRIYARLGMRQVATLSTVLL